MNKLFLDIETLPADDASRDALMYLYQKKLEKRQRRNNEQIAEFYTEDFEQFLLGTSFDGSFGKILCICYAINDEPVQELSGEETEILKKFWEIARNSQLFVGHNVMDFDLRFIYQRSVINGIRPSIDLNFARYRNNPIFDTMKEWTKWGQNSIGLEHVALALGLPTPKEGIDGSRVYEFYKAGKTNDIIEYCKRDVETTRAVYKRMTFQV